jgi:hypothetical protein
MRNLIIILLLTILGFNAKAQNLVPNGDFESHNSCSNTYGFSNCNIWTAIGSPDYFNSCITGGLSVPSNYFGYQYPASGQAYGGFFTHVNNTSSPNNREMLTVGIPSLTIGSYYDVSMSVSLSENSDYACNGLGIYFFDNPTFLDINIIYLTPKVSFVNRGIINNMTSWTRLETTIQADSAYKRIVIGNHLPFSSMSYDTITTGSSGMCLYYLDSVFIKLIRLKINSADTLLCPGDTITTSFTVLPTAGFTSSNIFTLQLSDANGSFNNPTNLATKNDTASGIIKGVIPSGILAGTGYRVRIKSNSPIDSSDVYNKNIIIGNYPNKPVASSNSPVCSGDTLRLNATTTTTGNITYLWMGPNSLVSTFQNTNIPNAAVSNSGSYIVTAAIYGCGTKDTVIATVNPSPIAITAAATTPVCVADTLRLYSTNSTTGAAYSWVGPNSFTSSIQNPYIANTTIAAAGDYIATASLSNGCTRKDTVTVQVRPLPANFNAVAGNTCEGNTFFLAGNTSSAGVSFSWTGPNGFTSTLQNPNISPATTAATGNYYVTGVLNGCSIRDTVYGSVYPIPARPLPIANTPVCVGQDLKLNVSNPQSGTYSWQGIGGYSAAVVNPVRSSATTAMAGKYYVTVTANGCASDKDSVMVVVNPAPSINMYPSPKDSICQGATLTFISSTANAGTSYQRYWYRNNNVIGVASNANYSTTTAADNDEYYVTLVATGVCAEPYTDTSNKITMRVFPWLPASVSITANPSTTVPSGTMINFTATPVNGGNKPTYQWTRNGNPVVGALSNIWGASTLSHNDEICLNMSSSYLCPNPKTAKSNCIKVSIETTGISGIAGNPNIKVYPNPVRDVLNIDGIKAGNTIMLYDVSGRLLLQQTALTHHEVISTSAIASGVYQLVVTDNSTITRFRITKE